MIELAGAIARSKTASVKKPPTPSPLGRPLPPGADINARAYHADMIERCDGVICPFQLPSSLLSFCHGSAEGRGPAISVLLKVPSAA
jgi:hypothetical protein